MTLSDCVSFSINKAFSTVISWSFASNIWFFTVKSLHFKMCPASLSLTVLAWSNAEFNLNTKDCLASLES
uniref:Uncharacterized protein n=1 Tax=Arundo donax TaxID=35708 RepID=A0A0A9DYI9_ARUDO